MNRGEPLPLQAAPRCGAQTRRGSSCCAPAMPNGRCRLHGGHSPGGPKGSRNGNFRHGGFTCKAIAEWRMLSAWIKTMRQAAQEVA
jgi:hypothetical protein